MIGAEQMSAFRRGVYIERVLAAVCLFNLIADNASVVDNKN